MVIGKSSLTSSKHVSSGLSWSTCSWEALEAPPLPQNALGSQDPQEWLPLWVGFSPVCFSSRVKCEARAGSPREVGVCVVYNPCYLRQHKHRF